MDEIDGARTFQASGAAYDSFMGRYSIPLAAGFADAAHVRRGQSALDIGCGPGALTSVLVERLGPVAVAACDPSPDFVAECASRHPDVQVRQGHAEALPYDDATFDRALAQLVLHFVSDPEQSGRELVRVVRPGGLVAACVWDFDGGMEMLSQFWAAATAADPDAPDEARTLRFGRPGEIVEVFQSVGLNHVTETTLGVSSTYADFDELWSGFLAGIGPAGAYCVALGQPERSRLREELFARLGSPDGPLTLHAVARCAVGRVDS